MNVPMNRKMSGSPNGANATAAGATPHMTAAATPRNAVTAMGMASVTHKTTTAARIAPNRCAGPGNPLAITHAASAAKGASTNPLRCRHKSKLNPRTPAPPYQSKSRSATTGDSKSATAASLGVAGRSRGVGRSPSGPHDRRTGPGDPPAARARGSQRRRNEPTLLCHQPDVVDEDRRVVDAVPDILRRELEH